jgi:predicted small lipoprotein YifL
VTDLFRRRFLRLVLVGAAAAPLAACGKRGALQQPYTPEEKELEARRAAGDPTAPRPKPRKAEPIKGPMKETPLDFLL